MNHEALMKKAVYSFKPAFNTHLERTKIRQWILVRVADPEADIPEYLQEYANEIDLAFIHYYDNPERCDRVLTCLIKRVGQLFDENPELVCGIINSILILERQIRMIDDTWKGKSCVLNKAMDELYNKDMLNKMDNYIRTTRDHINCHGIPPKTIMEIKTGE